MITRRGFMKALSALPLVGVIPVIAKNNELEEYSKKYIEPAMEKMADNMAPPKVGGGNRLISPEEMVRETTKLFHKNLTKAFLKL